MKKIYFLFSMLVAVVFAQTAIGQVYLANFDDITTTTTPKPYTGGTVLSGISNQSMTANTAATTFSVFAGVGTPATKALAVAGTAALPNPTFTLTFDVQTSKKAVISKISFRPQRSGTGPQNCEVKINGVSLGTQAVLTAFPALPLEYNTITTNYTGTVTIEFITSGASGTTGTFRFDDVTVAGSVAALPVTMTKFYAQNDKKSIELNWETASETNNLGFEIERKSLNQNWERIGFVNGNGTSNQLNAYRFADEKPQVGLNYYRLKQNDFDGKFELSHIISAKGKANELVAFPNPIFAGVVYVNAIEEKGGNSATIIDAMGKLVLLQMLTQDLNAIDVSRLPQGIYSIKVGSQNRLIEIH